MKLFIPIVFCCLCLACNFEEPYNTNPCKGSFKEMRQFCKTTYPVRSWAMNPYGFKVQGEYDTHLLDCSKWGFKLGIETCDQAIFDNTYLTRLSNSIFNDALNSQINEIVLSLDECNLQGGQKYADYRITRKNIASGIPQLKRVENVKIVKQTGITTNLTDSTKTINFLINYLPENPDSIAWGIWKKHNKNKDYIGVHLKVENTQSELCTNIEFDYLFK